MSCITSTADPGGNKIEEIKFLLSEAFQYFIIYSLKAQLVGRFFDEIIYS